MAQQKGVNVEKLQGGLNRLANSTDSHIGLIYSGLPVGAVATAIANGGKGVVLNSLYDAEVLGINESFDANNNIKIYQDIEEYFRLAPEATLYLFNSIVEADVKGFINQNKEIKGYGFHFNFDTESPNLVSTINLHQAVVNALATENRYLDFVIVGADELDKFTENLFALNAPNVSVLIGCNDASGITSVGSFLGMLAVRKISENVGSVDIEKKPFSKRGTEDYPLTDIVLSKWMDAFITSGVTIDSLNASEFNNLREKGYITAASYEGYAGYFFENSYTCIDRGSDYAQIENNRVWNKAVRIIRSTLIPRVKSKVKKNPTTGFIASTTVSYWETLLAKALGQMVKDDDCSGFEVVINPEQVVNSSNPVRVRAQIVADGIVHEFEVAVGLTNNV